LEKERGHWNAKENFRAGMGEKIRLHVVIINYGEENF
jgi:hypothetical protein